MAAKQIMSKKSNRKITRNTYSAKGGDFNSSMTRSQRVLNAIQRLGILGGTKARNTRKYGEFTAAELSNSRKEIRTAKSTLSFQKDLIASGMPSRVTSAQRNLQTATQTYKNARATARAARANARAARAGHSYA